MTAPPLQKRRAVRENRPTHDSLTRLHSHGSEPRTSAIPRQWVREGCRLIAEAQRSQLARDWRAATVHLAGVLMRMGAN